VSAPPLTIIDMGQQQQQPMMQPPARSPAHSGGQQQIMRPPAPAPVQQWNMQSYAPPSGPSRLKRPGKGMRAALSHYADLVYRSSEGWRLWLWIAFAIIALGGVVGVVLALV
jgi:hypothetical protein